MASYNKIQLTGKLSDTPDIKATTNGHSLSKFTLIVPRVESLPNLRFDYIRVTAWRDNADKTAAYKKDDILFVEGRILTDSYEDASTGQRKWTTEVDAKQIVNFNDVFSDNPTAPPVAPSPPAASAPTPAPTPPAPPTKDSASDSNDSPPIENVPIPPVDEAAFFKNSPANEESKNELDEDVPF